MPARPIVGLIVPPADGAVPPEGPRLYPDVPFVSRGLGLGRLTPEGYDSVIDRVGELARELAAEGAAAVALMGTSLSFYRGPAFNARLIQTMREATGLPATTMSTGVINGLRAVGARRLAVGTAYVDEVNRRLEALLADAGFAVLALEGLGIDRVGGPKLVPDAELVALGRRVFERAPDADAVLISCGGLRTLDATVPIEEACGVPVVSSTPAAFRAAVRLVGHSGHAPGYGRLLALGLPAPTAPAAV